MLFKKRIRCDCCGIGEKPKNLLQILDSLYFCNMCVKNMITLYVTLNPIKKLCAHCPENETICQFCNPELILKFILDE